MIRVAELEFDEYNERELSAHSVSAHEVMQLMENTFTVRRNKRSGAGERQLIGRTNGGRVLTLILAPTAVPDRWRPVTGWDSTASERRALDG